MPIKFVSTNEIFIEKIKEYGFDAQNIYINEYVPDPNRKTYYVSPANSLCFMDGGIDYALSRIIFPKIETKVKNIVRQLGIKSIVGKPYLPIGSSIIVKKHKKDHRSLIVAPTMLLPQNVSMTKNAYYATMAILYNILINCEENLKDIDIIFTSLCCGYGKMDEDESIKQILDGIKDYPNYKPTQVKRNIIINEPNLHLQPKYYQNTEFFEINPNEIEIVNQNI